ncbi:hypothetical protein [Pseudomonas syringae]|uniref:hypothetical protein n=1 Tax=Pseudomonas syringae TaxID=317 RepID=UPI003F77748E
MAGIFNIGRDACLRDAARHKSTPSAQDRTQSVARQLRLSFLTLSVGMPFLTLCVQRIGASVNNTQRGA